MEVTTTRFNAGESAPDWLLSCEPIGPGSVPGKVLFGVPCDVIEFPEHYMVFPAILGPVQQVMYATGERCSIVAPGKQVRVAIGTLVVVGDVFGSMQAGAVFGAPPPGLAEKQVGQGAIINLRAAKDVILPIFLGMGAAALIWIAMHMVT